MTDATYFADSDLSSARHLQRAGQWDAALTALPLPDSPRKLLLRADILTDRHMWRLNEPDQALAAIEVIRDSQPQEARFLTAQLEYWRRILRPGAAEISGDPVAAFASLADDERFGGWSGFWYAVSLDNIEHDGPAAVPGYERALDHARGYGDLLLESYAVRHLGGHAWDAGEKERGVALFERSLDLRAARGARPHTAAAQAALADVLGQTPRADVLRAIVAATAEELGLTWLAGDR